MNSINKEKEMSLIMMKVKMNSPKCPRCGGEDFLELEQHRVDYSEEFEENKTIYTKPLKCLRCDFEFVPLREE